MKPSKKLAIIREDFTMGAFSTALGTAAAYARNSSLSAGVGSALGNQLDAAGSHTGGVQD